MDKVRGTFDFLREFDTAHSRVYFTEALGWEVQRVYPAIAQIISLEEGQVHVDLGAGALNLVRHLGQTYPKATVVGVERSPDIITGSVYYRERFFGDVAATFHQEWFCQFKDGTFGSLYGYSDEDGDNQEILSQLGITEVVGIKKKELLPHLRKPEEFWEDLHHPVRAVIDDMRSLDFLKKLLGQRKIQSASLMFPGMGIRAGYERPHQIHFDAHGKPRRIPRRQEEQRGNIILQRAIVNTIDQMTQLMEPGGILTMIDRFGGDAEVAGDEMMGEIIGAHFNRIKHVESFWDVHNTGRIKQILDRPEQTPEWVNLKGVPFDTSKVVIGFSQFCRK